MDPRMALAHALMQQQNDQLLAPPRNPARLPPMWESAAIEAIAGPVQQAGQALRGQLTDTEAQDFAMMAAMGAIGPRMGRAAGTIDDLLNAMGIPFRKEASRFSSEALGPSGSVYYKVETPSGPRQIRMSDHDAPTGAGPLDFRWDDDLSKVQAAIDKEFGAIPSEFHQGTRQKQMNDLANSLAAAKRRLAEQEAAGRVYASTRSDVQHWTAELEKMKGTGSR